MNQTNLLRLEKSPYLLQHRDNPVNWHPWGEVAFAKARAENKPIFLSIGYSTCYWCHVMEKDSFELEEVAQALNQSFVSIKVDREERPDVDSIYMDAVVAMTGHGGWPMSVFLTPALKPFYGGTYFPRAQFLTILSRISELWKREQQQLLESAEQLLLALKRELVSTEAQQIPSVEVLTTSIEHYARRFDQRHGGFGQAPKFPPHQSLPLLLRVFHHTNSALALEMATQTLDSMARGGIYDQLRGGFARYSVDERWLVPHFEKMLYDNAQLVIAYLEAFQVTGSVHYAEIARETLDYVLAEMTSDEGGFYSAQDAGEVGKEGEYYVWKESELRKLLTGEEFNFAKTVWDLPAEGNFEHGQIVLSLLPGTAWSVKSDSRYLAIRKKLLTAREQRVPPHTDDKVLTAWNGLMIAAMARGSAVLNEKRYLAAAQSAADFIQRKLLKSGRLERRYRDGEAGIAGVLEDYSFLIFGLLALGETEFTTGIKSERIQLAERLQAKQDELFWDEERFGYFSTTIADVSLIRRKKEFEDNATPSANGIAAQNLLRLYLFTGNADFKIRAEKLLACIGQGMARFPSAYASAAQALDFYRSNAQQIVLVGPQDSQPTQEFLRWLHLKFLPNKTVMWSNGEEAQQLAPLQGKVAINGKVTFYICADETCKEPTVDPERAKALVQ